MGGRTSNGTLRKVDSACSGRRVIALVFFVVVSCIVLRSAVVLTVLHTDPGVVRQADSGTYSRPAMALLDDGRFSESVGNPTPEFLRTPGYPAFIALVYLLAGHHVAALLLAQVVVGAATVLVAFFLGRRMASSAVGLVAAALLVLEPLQLYTAGTILTETLATLCISLVALFGFIAFATPKPALRWPFLLGLVLAIGTLVRPVTYYLPVLVVALVVVAVARRRTPWRHGAAMLAVFLLPLVVLVGGWQLRNHEAVGSWRFSGIEAKNLYLFRAAAIVASHEHVQLHVAQRRLLAELGKPDRTRQGPYYEHMYRRGLDIVEGHPIAALQDAFGGLVDEITSAQSRFFAYVGVHDPPPILGGLASGLLLLLYLFGAIGVVDALRTHRERFGHAFVLALAAYVLVASAGPEAAGGRGERFRSVVMPIIIVYAARGTIAVATKLRTSARRSNTQTHAAMLPPSIRAGRSSTNSQ